MNKIYKVLYFGAEKLKDFEHFKDSYKDLLGVDLFTRSFDLNELKVAYLVWDLSMKDEHKELTDKYCRDSKAAILNKLNRTEQNVIIDKLVRRDSPPLIVVRGGVEDRVGVAYFSLEESVEDIFNYLNKSFLDQ